MKALGLALLLAIPRDSDLPGPEGSSVVGVADPAARALSGAPQDAKPFKPPPREPLDFRGPGREAPEPDVDEVVLGWFGPGDPDHPDFGDFWRGASLALEEENAAGGYQGKPFRLVPAWSESPWKAGIVEVARLVQERGAWAVIGGVDGTTTHLAMQIALKSHFLLLSPGSTDATTDHANVPWLFSLPPSDEPVSLAVADAISEATSGRSFTVLAATDHDSHAALVALRRALGERRLTPATLVEVAPLEADVPALARRLRQEDPRLVVVLAPSTLAGRLVSAIRASGYRGAIVGGAPAARSAFGRAAGVAAEGVIAPLQAEPGLPWEAFALSYGKRWGEAPDDAAAHGYDAVRLVAAAVRHAGLNRARIRDAVRALAPWQGASGPVDWNPLGRNARLARVGVWRGGRFSPSPHP